VEFLCTRKDREGKFLITADLKKGKAQESETSGKNGGKVGEMR